jgi:AraC-like DNA-binding protein
VSAPAPLYERHLDFYAAEYGAYIRRIAEAGSVTIMEALQTPGDFSDVPTGDLVIGRVKSRGRVKSDFGNGTTYEWWRPGDIAVAPAGFGIMAVADHHHTIECAAVAWSSLRDVDVEGRLPADGHFGTMHSRHDGNRAFGILLDQLWSVASETVDLLASDSVTLAIYDQLVGWRNAPESARRPMTETLPPRALRLCIERLGSVGAETVSITELAALCRLSPHHFCRAFKTATGLPPHRYQILLRMERARILLGNAAVSVADVGAAVGYDDAAYFSRLFARETGVSPSAWRRERLS